jgi:hypothetical protein
MQIDSGTNGRYDADIYLTDKRQIILENIRSCSGQHWEEAQKLYTIYTLQNLTSPDQGEADQHRTRGYPLDVSTYVKSLQ